MLHVTNLTLYSYSSCLVMPKKSTIKQVIILEDSKKSFVSVNVEKYYQAIIFRFPTSSPLKKQTDVI